MKIILTGPESTGKTTLANQLADHYGGVVINEYAREYLDEYGSKYVFSDLLKIAKGQVELELKVNYSKNAYFFFDTDLITIKIWSLHKFSAVNNWILKQIENQHNTFYLLCKPDLEWTFDPLRESPFERNILFERYIQELNHYKRKYQIVEGFDDQRLKNAIDLVENFIKKPDTH